MWLAAVLAAAAAALAAATEQLYHAAARNWWRHHPHRDAVTGRVALAPSGSSRDRAAARGFPPTRKQLPVSACLRGGSSISR